MIDRDDLPGGETTLRQFKIKFHGPVWRRLKVGGRGRVAVADSGEDVLLIRDRLVDPAEGISPSVIGVKSGGARFVEGDVQGVGREILLHDDEVFVVGVGGQADAFTLADGVAM